MVQIAKNHGFSLVELLVVVSIIAILSVSSVLGFGYLGDILRAKEVSGFISDSVKQEELKVLRGDFGKAVVHFLPDFLVIEESPEGATSDLSLGEYCENGWKIAYETGTLTQKDENGEVVQVRPVTKGSECITFKASKNLEGNYQLIRDSQFSVILRFVHFNLKRDDPTPFAIGSNPQSKIEILAPYGKKRLFKRVSENGSGFFRPADGLSILVQSNNASETIIFQMPETQ